MRKGHHMHLCFRREEGGGDVLREKGEEGKGCDVAAGTPPEWTGLGKPLTPLGGCACPC